MFIVWVGKYRAGLSEDLGFASLMTQNFSKHGCPRWGRGRAWIIEIPKRIIFILVQVPTSLDTSHKTGCLHLCLQAAFSPRSPPPDPHGGTQAARVRLLPWASCRGPRLPQEWLNYHPLAWLRPSLLCFIAEAHSASPVGPGSLWLVSVSNPYHINSLRDFIGESPVQLLSKCLGNKVIVCPYCWTKWGKEHVTVTAWWQK